MLSIKHLYIVVLAALMPLAFASCGDDEPYYKEPPIYPDGEHGGEPGGSQGGGQQPDDDQGSDELNQYEQSLVGSYVTTDATFYLVLNDNLTGYYMALDGNSWYSENVTWQADESNVYFTYTSDGEQIYMEYAWRGGYLMLGDYELVANTSGLPDVLNQYEAVLVGSYKTFNDPNNVFYIVLNQDRTGYYYIVEQGQDDYSEAITWQADESNVYFTYVSDGEQLTLAYSWSGGILYMGDYVLVANTELVPQMPTTIYRPAAIDTTATRAFAATLRLRTSGSPLIVQPAQRAFRRK